MTDRQIDVYTDGKSLRIAVRRREHAPATIKLDRYSARRNLQDMLHHQAARAFSDA